MKLDYDLSENQYHFPEELKYTNEKEAVIYAIVEEGEQIYSAIKEIEFGQQSTYQLNIEPTNPQKIDAILSKYGLPRTENSFRRTDSACCYMYDRDSQN